MPLGEEIGKKTLNSGDTVTIHTMPRPKGDSEEHYKVTITDKQSIASISFPHEIQAQTLERALAIFDDIKPDDTYESVFNRCRQYFE